MKRPRRAPRSSRACSPRACRAAARTTRRRLAEQAALGGEVAARVGTDVIPVSLVVKVAAAQHITPREALRRLVDDAVAANAARARGPRSRASDRVAPDGRARSSDRRPHPRRREASRAAHRRRDRRSSRRATGARSIVRRASASCTPSCAARRTPDPAAEERARAFARAAPRRGRRREGRRRLPARRRRLFRIPASRWSWRRLPAFTEDGDTSIEGEGRWMQAFAKGAFAIAGRRRHEPRRRDRRSAGTSSGSSSAFPEQRMPLEARRIAFADEVYMMRARAATKARLEALASRRADRDRAVGRDP